MRRFCRVLRTETLDRLGGAEEIVSLHLDAAVGSLSARRNRYRGASLQSSGHTVPHEIRTPCPTSLTMPGLPQPPSLRCCRSCPQVRTGF